MSEPAVVPTWRRMFLPAGLAVVLFLLLAMVSSTLGFIAALYSLVCAGLDFKYPVAHTRLIAHANAAATLLTLLIMLYGAIVMVDTVAWRNRGAGLAGTIMPGGIGAFHDVCPDAQRMDYRYIDEAKRSVDYRCWKSSTPIAFWPFYTSGRSGDIAERIASLLSGALEPPQSSSDCSRPLQRSDLAAILPADCVVAVQHETNSHCTEAAHLLASNSASIVPHDCVARGTTVVNAASEATSPSR